MFRKAFFVFLLLIIYHPIYAERTFSSSVPNFVSLEPFRKEDCILILAPHPDDEAIGCAGIIQEAVKIGAQIKIVFLTNGDHNQAAFIVYEKRLTMRKNEFIHMGEVRRKESIKAMQFLGVDEKNFIFLGYPDFGTFTIFSRYWGEGKPFRSILTRISSVPYKDNFSFGAPYKGESILNDLKKIILEYRPNKIFVSHPADVNVDHKSFYLFLEVALADLKDNIPKPQIYPYLIHCIGWPLPRHYHPELTLEPPQKFLYSQINWQQFKLASEQLEKKYRSILCYRSQTQSSAFYLLAFCRQNELFGGYPEIELKKQGALKERSVSFNTENQVSYKLQENNLLICIDKTTDLNSRLSTIIYLFGYNYSIPFASMPKIRIITKHDKFKVFIGKKIIKPVGVSLELTTQGFIFKIPLKVLGEPDFILVSLRVYGENLPGDVMGFRKINLR